MIAKTHLSHRRLAMLALAGAFALARPAGAAVAEVTQSFQLQPGWNAVFLEVRPENNASEAVFAGLPLASAWTWNPAQPKVEFVDDPDELIVPTAQWLGYFPFPRPESILTNLFAVQANRAYLLKIDGGSPVTWNVTGRPEVQSFRWIPDSFNLVGFPVDPLQQPTFGQYLAPSEAHVGQPIYRLVGGNWQEIPNPFAAQIRSGEAYWVYCKGPSSYTGPVSIDLDLGKSLDFGGTSEQQRMRIRNLGNSPASISLRKLSSATPVPLAVFRFDADTGEISWPTLPQDLSLPTAAGEELLIDLSPLRAQFGADEVGGIIEVRDGFGFLRRVPVVAQRATAPPEFLAARAAEGRLSSFAVTTTSPFAGLWTGTVKVRKVSQAQTGDLVPTPVGQEFAFRVIVHVDASGTARLLKEVIQLWKEGTMIPDPQNPGAFVVDVPGHYVLLTDESLIPNFEGAVLRDGEPVGYRLSTVGYDFEPQTLTMSGSFSTTGTLTAAITLDAESPTNPFRHKYHPDHNNLDELYVGFREEAYPVTRAMTFDFSATDPYGQSLPNYGDSEIGGVFSETLTGLHRNDIVVEGLFTLTRTAGTPSLNQ